MDELDTSVILAVAVVKKKQNTHSVLSLASWSEIALDSFLTDVSLHESLSQSLKASKKSIGAHKLRPLSVPIHH